MIENEDLQEIRERQEFINEFKVIVYRKFNKVKKIYQNKEDYIRIFKILIKKTKNLF